MPDQSQIDAEANQSDLAQRVAVLEDTIATLRRNLLEPAMTRPGLLRYGGNVMQLDGQGIQIVNSSSLNAPSLFYVPEFRTDADGTTPYAVLQGGANVVAGDEDVAALEMGIYPDTGLEGQVGLQSFNTATGVVGAFMSVESGGVISDLTLLTSAGAATLTLSNAVAILSVTADPTSFTNGMIWYNSTTNLFKARINGSTVTLGSGVATDAIWDAKGDLAVGTGADTAQKVSIGTDGMRLVADAANIATVGIGWQAILARTLLPSGSGSTNLTNYNKSVIVGTLTGNYTVNLYSASTTTGNGAGDAIWIKRADTSGFTLTIDASGSETIDGALTITLAPYEAVTLVSDGTNWWRT